jgi:hypothetical protein
MATTTAPTLSGQLRVTNADAQTQSPNSGFARNLLIFSRPSFWTSEHEQYSGSVKPEKYSGSAEHQNCLDSGNEKGRSSDPTLWDIYSANYETFVVHTSTYKKSVGQSEGASLALSASSLDSQASNTQEVKLAPGSCPLSTSTHWSMSLTNSCGKRIPLYTVLLFIWPFAMFSLHLCLNTIKTTAKLAFAKVFKQIILTCLNTIDNLFKHIEGVSQCQNSNAPEWWNTAEAPIHNVTKAYTMEYSHSTQTRPEKKYLWRFLALNRSDMCAKPCRISVEAPTEHDARRVLAPFFILSLSARLSARGVCNA